MKKVELKDLPRVELQDLRTSDLDFELPDHKAIINPDTEHVFAVASSKYKLVKHEEVLDNIEEVLNENPHYGRYVREIRLDREGGRMRCIYKFPDTEVPIRIQGKDDLMNPTLESFNSYDLSWRHTVMLGCFRIVCTNGMVVGEKFMQFRKRHMPDLYLEDVKVALETGMDKLKDQFIMWQGWGEKFAEVEWADKVIDGMQLNKKETRLLIEEKEVTTGNNIEDWKLFQEHGYAERMTMTWWIFFNIITQFITHRIASEVRKVELESRVRRAMLR